MIHSIRGGGGLINYISLFLFFSSLNVYARISGLETENSGAKGAFYVSKEEFIYTQWDGPAAS